uniref:universal stress protein n=1 Tax=Fulvivirga sp. TaxID=1931237 RepID=UPI00404B6DA7
MFYPLKRLLVCLDMTEFDEVLIEYTAMFAKAVKAEKIYFIHVVKSLEIPEKLMEEFPEMDTPLDETIVSKIRPLVLNHLPEEEFSWQIGIKDGNITENILKWAKIKHVDLIMMGRKPAEQGTGSNPSRIANVSLCSILMVPQVPPKTLHNIFIPIDFSPYSFRGIQRALSIRDKNTATICLQNVYKVPSGYHYTGKSMEEFAEIMKVNSIRDYEMFIKKNELNSEDFTYITSLDTNDDPADVISKEAKKQGSDLIIIGSRGRTAVASLLLGSIAVALLRHNFHIPLFIVKNKNENMGFFQALMRI